MKVEIKWKNCHTNTIDVGAAISPEVPLYSDRETLPTRTHWSAPLAASAGLLLLFSWPASIGQAGVPADIRKDQMMLASCWTGWYSDCVYPAFVLKCELYIAAFGHCFWTSSWNFTTTVQWWCSSYTVIIFATRIQLTFALLLFSMNRVNRQKDRHMEYMEHSL